MPGADVAVRESAPGGLCRKAQETNCPAADNARTPRLARQVQAAACALLQTQAAIGLPLCLLHIFSATGRLLRLETALRTTHSYRTRGAPRLWSFSPKTPWRRLVQVNRRPRRSRRPWPGTGLSGVGTPPRRGRADRDLADATCPRGRHPQPAAPSSSRVSSTCRLARTPSRAATPRPGSLGLLQYLLDRRERGGELRWGALPEVRLHHQPRHRGELVAP